MPVSVGSTDITNAYLGSTALEKVYVGAEQIWPAVATCTDVLAEPFNNLSNWTTLAGTPTIIAGRTGTALRLGDAAGTASVRYTIPSANESDTVTLGFAWRISNVTGRNILDFWSDGNVTQHVALDLVAGGSLRILRGSSILATSAAGLIVANTWYYIELRAKLGDAGVGSYEVRLNGSTVLGPTTDDTKNGGTKTTFETLRLYGYPSSSNNQQFDDLYISTGQGCGFKGSITIP